MKDRLKVGITGIDGMIGSQLHAVLHARPQVTVAGANRETFASEPKLDAFVADSDVVVHLAGMNRGDDGEVESVNNELVEKLISACERSDKRPYIIFSSSTHVDRDTAYGRSKRECGRRLRQWADDNRTSYTGLILPHVFGEGGKPFYNSVVSTFCYQLAVGQAPEILHDGELELVHAQQVADVITGLLFDRKNEDIRITGLRIKVSSLLKKLQEFDELYRSQLLPDVSNKIDLFFFNTYRSYLFPDFYPVKLRQFNDDRGGLFEAVKAGSGGQCFISITKPGITRGNHYHYRKVERFLVLGGTGLIRIRRLFDDKVHEFAVDGAHPQFIDMPTLHTHSICNVGKTEMITLFWSNEIFDPASPDTIAELV
ncbi:MAG: NAD-dependent epimerase/dehydratase [Gammaproteobacteria bacterium]|nr:MAG: NAD-dependent epimerase/dehydratase [Gammaproteobacteria bacterium]TND07022.1 MAG: NAD-dependent epimerase/dehydratase [Gammaproteobacteria bacterium]